MVATRDASKRSFLQAHTTRTIYRMGSPEWPDVKSTYITRTSRPPDPHVYLNARLTPSDFRYTDFILKYMRLRQALTSRDSSVTPGTEENSTTKRPAAQPKKVANSKSLPDFSPSFRPPNPELSPLWQTHTGQSMQKCVAVGWPLPNVEIVCAGHKPHTPDQVFEEDRVFHKVTYNDRFWFTAHD